MKSIRSGNRQSPNRVEEQDDGSCFVTGCTVPGSITQSTTYHDGRKWFCRFHFGEPVEKWGEITLRIRQTSQEDLGKAIYLKTQRVDSDEVVDEW